ncbi:class I SAM-dependent methyltransferase [Porphyromonadaceae sp. NP-X]|nr:class I SAM-dependent methyltransferase [Porphyromonadaceae sp. NP-X]
MEIKRLRIQSFLKFNFLKRKIYTLRNKNRLIFTEIFKKNSWSSQESFSGTGSTLEQTYFLRQELIRIINQYEIKTILDIPCGDFNWMKELDFKNLNYIGADIVKPLIKENRKKYQKSPNIKFKVIDLTSNKLPKCDIIIVRDCFVHLSFKDIDKSIKNIKRSKSKYLLTTTFTNRDFNRDSVDGGWRTINLEKEPFNLTMPLEIINEHCTENDGKYSDKSMALFLISNL